MRGGSSSESDPRGCGLIEEVDEDTPDMAGIVDAPPGIDAVR